MSRVRWVSGGVLLLVAGWRDVRGEWVSGLRSGLASLDTTGAGYLARSS